MLYRKWILPLLVLACVADGARVATYNLENYLLTGRRVDGRWRPDYPKPEMQKAALRAIISDARPDILAVQEIGTMPFLEEIKADLALDGLDFPYAVLMEGNDEERHIAVLSRIRPLEVVQHKDLDFNYFDDREPVKRGLLEVTFSDSKGKPWKLFNVHLKSMYTSDKRDPESSIRRVREAQACRDRIIERTFDMGIDRFIVVGDFNDQPNSGALRRFYQRGEMKISSAVPAFDSRDEVWTYFNEGMAMYSRVDYCLIAEGWRDAVKQGRGTIADGPGARLASDHRMVVIDLDIDQPSVRNAK